MSDLQQLEAEIARLERDLVELRRLMHTVAERREPPDVGEEDDARPAPDDPSRY